MTDHHDHDLGFPDDHHDPLPLDDSLDHQQPVYDDDHGYDHDDWLTGHEGHDAVDEPHVETTHEDLPELEPNEEAAAVTADDPVDVFPPALDVGDLPEPVDGFPWIDTGSLGVVDPATLHDTPLETVDAHELAAYAAEDLPPGADPWAALESSDDPATAALARWWQQN